MGTASTETNRYAKRSLGQNFLTDGNFVDKIVNAVELTSEDAVVEIGPGRGALTQRLIEHAKKVTAIELDREMVRLLEERFTGSDNFELITGNVLDINFTNLRPTAGRLKLVANLPYYISTAVLQHLIRHRHAFSQMVLMFQREVADRITAKPGNSERGFLTVLVEAFLDSEKLFDVPPSAFRPRPKVWSSVVRLVPKADDWELVKHETAFKDLVGAAFRQKRKTIFNNLRSAARELDIDDPMAVLVKCGIDPRHRAETLKIEEWKCLLKATVSLP
jgi:16S rRNA (adenine1518-N6/adenine1519-N6)-dimethyltransferase